MSDQNPNYEIGYGRPPKQHRFQPGQSGNPKGRPKKPKDFPSIIARVSKKTICVTEQGETKSVTRLEALAMLIVDKALKGEPWAIKFILPLMERATDPEDFEVNSEAEAILQDYLSKHQDRRGLTE